MAGQTACGVAASMTMSRTLSGTGQSLSDGPALASSQQVRRRWRRRQVDGHGRALVKRALDRDEAATVTHDPIDEGQAEARTLADLLRGEERLEQVRLDLGRHADAIVADAHAHVVSGRHRG